MQRRVINPWQWQEAHGFVHAHEVTGASRLVHLAGQVACDGDGQPLHAGDIAAQVFAALDNVEQVLTAAGLTLADVVRMNYFTTDVAAFIANGPALTERLRAADCQPASTLLGVSALWHPEVLVEIEATAAA